VKLGKRLSAIAAMVLPGSRIADIGTDHAYLPIYLVSQGISPAAVAGDVHKGPYESAKETVTLLNLSYKIAVRFGDGLAVLTPGEADTAVIAGMGGPNIIEILDARPEIVASLSRLILQPMIGSAGVRRWLAENGWRLLDETLVEEEGRLYEIMAAERGEAVPVEPVLYEIGPLLWEQRHPLLKTHLDNLIGQYSRVVAEMAGGKVAAASPKYREYQEKIAELEAKKACL
jgi:tRNA (adenine22-N1)-methyltransferase